ncbi:MAG: family 43 glycosylhydrolase [Muribaculaceae bacterium]|nr:family 43 glycosylhydrolase [Muribaculaceae bacterium]
MNRLTLTLTSLLATICLHAGNNTPINGEVWLDTSGNPINAHGGGILHHGDTYYWYGEYKGKDTYRSPNIGWECYRTDFTGVSCYSSTDLINWNFEGVVLTPDPTNSTSDLHPTMVIERPKVIYNDNTKQFVMWMHVDDHNYWQATAGVAVSDSPTGPFRFIEAIRPNGAESRDLTVYKDDDGKAYLLYSSEGNATLYISRLTDDYLKQTGVYTRNFAGKSREAPAIFKNNGKYYIISSGCSGWSPNEAAYAVADNIMGPYELLPNPCTGVDADKTFYSQSTFALQLKDGSFIAMFDRWKKENLIDSRYVWLPIDINEEGITIPWTPTWTQNMETDVDKK